MCVHACVCACACVPRLSDARLAPMGHSSYVSQLSALVEDSETDSEEEEDGGYDSDVQREKEMDYVSKTYAHPARDATAGLKGAMVEKKPATDRR